MQKFYLSLLFIFLISIDAFSFSDSASEVRQSVIVNGISLGSIVAAITSWERNRSVLLMIIHTIFSWLYVFYFLLTRKKSERK